jgi:uncharacterized protein YndB with AHSA1/START domain
MKSSETQQNCAPPVNTGNLKVTTPSDREIVMTREFDAPRRLVWEAYTRPELLKRWLGVFGDWTMPVCEVDLRPGGAYRYEWHNRQNGQTMGLSGILREVVVPERIVSTEKFDDPWYEGEAVATVTFTEVAGKTTLSMAVRYDSQATRDSVLKSGMEQGVAASFDILAEILAAQRK